MIDFESEHWSLIEERQHVLNEIERVLFTKRYKLSKKHLDIFTVQSVAMIYSIWEGFIQQSFQLYIKYLNSLNIKFKEFSNEIIMFHMENTFKQLREYPDKSSKKIKYFESLEKHFLEEYHEIYSVIDTGSNVSFEVLNSLLEQFSLEKFPEYWDIYTYPNANLKQTMSTFLRYRNGVAHGGDISSEEKVTQEVFNKYKLLVNNLMHEIHLKFIFAINNKVYLKQSL